MSGMNVVTLVGRLTKDAELRYIPGSGTAVATTTIAIDRDYTKKDGSKETDFIPLEVMGKPAEFVANYCGKGRLVAVVGTIKVDKYQGQDGTQKTFTKVGVKSIQALDSNKDKQQQGQGGQFEPSFGAIDSDDVPF